jgi:mRNA interferase RelE/StbE
MAEPTGGEYTVRITRKAQKELRELGHQARERIRPKMLALADDPRPPGVKKLAGEDNLWRIRVGDYRVIYQISDRELVVLVVRVRHRSDAYQ